MKQRDEALALGPDGYSRFFVIIHLLERLYSNTKKPIKVLDVGGCSPYMQELLDKSSLTFDLTILDILPKPPEIKVRYIQDDATKSDLPDGSFDVVISTDTLEHIPKDAKDDFVRACVRLCKGVCILAAPFDTPGVHKAEQFANDFNKQLFKVGQDWLEEHFEFGKPSVAQTSKVLDDLQVAYAHFGTNNLYSWVMSTHLNLIEAKLGTDKAASEQAKRTYNAALARSVEFSEPSYRHFFVAYKDKGLADNNPLAHIADPADPAVFAAYIHEQFSLLAERMTELRYEGAAAKEKHGNLEQLLSNERVHSQKLNEELLRLHAELKRLEPLRRLARLRRPGHVVGVVKKRLSGK
jgi:ubiquinone/menaquinone biosynthesis C-methylase UbiE